MKGLLMARRSVLTVALALAGAIPVSANAAPAAPHIVWSTRIGVPVYAPLRVGQGDIYLTSVQDKGPNVFALNSATGKISWRYATHGAIAISPTVGKTQIFVASDIGQVHFMRALDARTGSLVWQYTRTNPPECMCSHDAHTGAGLVFTQTDGHSLYAFAPIGVVPSRRIWQFKGDGAKLTTPTVSNGVVVLGSADHNVYALDAKTGAVRWTAKTGYGFVARPTIVGGAVIIGNRGGTVHAYDLSSGKPIWSFSTSGAIDTRVVTCGNIVYLASEDRNIYALDAKSGKLLWQSAMADYTDYAPLIAGSAVIAGNRAGDLVAFSAADGKEMWRSPLGGTPFSQPTVWNHAIVLKIGDHAVGAFAALSGKPLWRYGSKAVLTPPVLGATHIYLASSAGRVIALD